MESEEKTVKFTRTGVTVEEERQAPLSDEMQTVVVDDLSWDEFSIRNLEMVVSSIDPVPSDDDTLAALHFEVASLAHSYDEIQPSQDNFWKRVKRETGITRNGGEISLRGDVSAKENLVSFVQFLFKSGLVSIDDLPITSGWKRNLINTEPTHQKGEPMSQSEPVADGDAYVETKHSRSAIKQKITELADEFGE